MLLLIKKIKRCKLTMNNSGDSNRQCKPRLSKLISFLSLIRQVILDKLKDWNNLKDKKRCYC